MASLNVESKALGLNSPNSSSERSAEASTSYKTQLPDKKTFVTILSGGAFVVGMTGATIYGLRKAKLQALKEAQELAQASAASVEASSPLATPATATVPAALRARSSIPASFSAPKSHTSADAPEEPQSTEGEVSTGAFALFRQMNAAILNRSTPSDSATRAPTSVFDDDTGALPVVLRRRRATPTPSPGASSSHQAAPTPIVPSSTHDAASLNNAGPSASAASTLAHGNDAKIDYSEMDSTLDFLGLSTPVPIDEQRRLKAAEERASNEMGPTSFFQSPVGLSLKAFFIATSIVTFSTLVVVEVAQRALGVKTMDEFVVTMTTIVPSRRSGEASLEGAAPHMRVARDGSEAAHDVTGVSGRAAPKSVDQTLTDLSNASSFEEWVSALKNQLDVERDHEVERRFAGLAASASNDSVSSSSSRTYSVHSPLEFDDLERNASFFRTIFSISPVLPSTAFGLGLVSGVMTSGKRAGLVFMAENAHRLPDTVQGWYFYSKTKNYKVLLGAAKGGLKQGVRLGVWTTGFCFAERLAELARGSLQSQLGSEGREVEEGFKVLGHWTDGALAGVGTAAAATALYKLPKPAAARVFQLGLLAGASTGAIRDLQERLVHREIGGVASHP